MITPVFLVTLEKAVEGLPAKIVKYRPRETSPKIKRGAGNDQFNPQIL